MKKVQFAKIEFDGRDVPVATDFDDPYFSFADGLRESEYVFLSGNQISERLKNGFQIAELGFGTGLNAILTWRKWVEMKKAGDVYFTSFEAFPMNPKDQARSLQIFPELDDFATKFIAEFDGERFQSDGFHLQVIKGDARQTLRDWGGKADAWFLDGFSPAKNPELWEMDLMREVYEHTNPQGTFATYSAAGFVRANLKEAGFEVERVKGFGTKRHMSVGRKV